MVRLFAALSIPDEIGQALARRQDGLAGARWRPLDALHVTLRFYGELREDIARDLDAELVTVGARPFDMVLQGAGSFADDSGVNAVWAGVAETPALRQLARACEMAGRRAGLKPDLRHWRPHVTLAYLRGADPAAVAHWIQANNLLKSPPIRVERFGLYSSFLGKARAHYRLEAEYPLPDRPPKPTPED